MARKVETTLIDDITGEPADRTITFSVGNVTYEFDASSETASEFDAALAGYIESARRLGKAGAAKTSTSNGKVGVRLTIDRMQSAAIRRWARDHGYNISDRGRISAEIMDSYNRGGSLAATG